MMSRQQGLLAAVAVLAVVAAIVYFPWPDRSGRVQVTGLVTLDGVPLEVIPGSNVVFEGLDLDQGRERTASGQIDRQSRYRIDVHRSARGLYPGRYKVSVKGWKLLPGWDPNDPYAPLPPAAVPKRYEDADESGLVVEVTSQRRQTIDLPLVTEKPR
jgi:hypothetical protein